MMSSKNYDQNYDLDSNGISFSYQEWFRLRELWNNIVAFQRSVQLNSNKLQEYISEENNYRSLASDLQNLNGRVKILDRNVTFAREMIRTTRYRMGAIVAENERSKQEMREQLDLNVVQSEIHEKQEQNQAQMTSLRKLRNELIFRRRFMFKDLYELYFPQIGVPPVYRRNCHCLKFDMLRGLHLPTVAARLGHNDAEVCAATGFLVHLLQSIARILSHPLKHPVQFKGSCSRLFIRANVESHNLFSSTSSKTSRDRFDHALYLLCESVVQLRADCGIGARELDRPIRLLHELLLSFIGEHKFNQADLIFKFGKYSNFSPTACITVDV